MKKYVLRLVALIAAGAVLAGCGGVKFPAGSSEWSSFMHDDARTNLSPDKVSPPLDSAWTKDLSAFNLFKGYPKYQLSSPALSNGVLYVGSTDSSFYAIDASKGKVLWSFDAHAPLEAPPAVAGDNVYFGSSDGYLRCVDKSGKLLWKFAALSEVISSPVVRDGRVYFVSADDRFYALSAKTGEKLWTYYRRSFPTVSPRIYASPAYFDKKLYAYFSEGTLVCFEAESGKVLWTRTLVKDPSEGGTTRRSPLVYNGVVYALDGSNAVLALDSSTGDIKGIYNIIKAEDFVVRDARTLIMAGADRVVALDMSTGAILWNQKIAHSPLQSVFAAGDNIFILSNQESRLLGIYFFTRTKGFIEAIRMSDGSKVWDKQLDSSISASGSSYGPAIALLPDDGELVLYTGP